jgi:hypothetical protein
MKFRPVRGGLSEAMAEARDVTREELIEIAKDVTRNANPKLEIIHQGFDARIGWESYLVCVDDWGPIGYINEKIEV